MQNSDPALAEGSAGAVGDTGGDTKLACVNCGSKGLSVPRTVSKSKRKTKANDERKGEYEHFFPFTKSIVTNAAPKVEPESRFLLLLKPAGLSGICPKVHEPLLFHPYSPRWLPQPIQCRGLNISTGIPASQFPHFCLLWCQRKVF